MMVEPLSVCSSMVYNGIKLISIIVREWWVIYRKTCGCLGLMGVVYFVLATTSLHGKSVTIDEFGHLPVGYNLLQTGDFRYCELNPPLMNALSALPVLLINPKHSNVSSPFKLKPSYNFWQNGYRFMFDYWEDYHRIFIAARWVTVALIGLLGLLLFFWARVIIPNQGAAGLMAVGLLWFSPNVLAHATLVTTDAGAACFIRLAVWAFHMFWLSPNGKRAFGCGIALGLAQLVKFTAVYLYPVFIVLTLIWKFCHPGLPWKDTGKWTCITLIMSLFTINAGYLFQGSSATLGDFAFVSDTMKSVQSIVPDSIPIFLPREYVAAFDRQIQDVKIGDPSYLLGESYKGGRWYYFITLIAFKTPIPLFGLGMFTIVVGIFGRGVRLFESLLFLLPGAVILIMFSFFSNKQLGLRMILPAAPLIYLWIATTITRARRKRWTTCFITGLLLWYGAESIYIYPDYLAYFNQIKGGPAGGHHVALDSNLDWGQDLPKLKRYMDDHGIKTVQLLYFGRVAPEIYGINYEVNLSRLHQGYLAISASLFGRGYLLYDHGRLAWIPKIEINPKILGEPVARLGYSIHVYRLEHP